MQSILPSDKQWLGEVSCEEGKKKREAVLRRKSFEELSVEQSELERYLNQGWEEEKKLKRKVKIKKAWSHDQKLENKVWLLFYLLGYDEISRGRDFKVLIERKGADSYHKQIDVLAKDDETVIVAECKSSRKPSRRSLQKDIEEFSNLKGPISKAIKNSYASGFKPKIIWLLITNNIILSAPDRARLDGARINLITEKELRYYLQIADHLRGAARFQFLAEYLKNQKIPEMEGVKVPCVKGKLGGKTFYSFVSTPRQMLKIAFVNHRSLNDPSGAPSYQRLVSRTRLRQISNFIHQGGFFPTNILVNFTNRVVFERKAKNDGANVVFGDLILPCKYRSAWVIDGQHRLYGYAPLSSKYLDQNIMVVAFEGLKKEEEANMFVTINHEQKSVPKNLLDDLEGELKWGSDKPLERIGAISARLIGLLNEDLGEPFYGRVTRQGIPPTDKTCLTVPALKDGLRKSGLVGEAIMKRKEYKPGPLSDSNDNSTLDRARNVLNNFFQILVSSNEKEWEKGRGGYLCTNVSLQAYLMLLSSLISYMESNKGFDARNLEATNLISEIEEYLDPLLKVLSSSSAMEMENRFKVQFGSGGPKEYYFRLCQIIKEQYSDFSPEGMDEWLDEQSDERISDADSKLKELNINVQKVIFTIFKKKYGEAYWNKGVIDKKIKARAYEKSLDDEDDALPLENYLDFIEYKKIVEHKMNWELFKPIFDIPEPGEKGYTKNVRWMERVNELRRIPAHATEKRQYKSNDFDYIDFIYEEFTKRMNESFVMEGDYAAVS